jgi:hypothetical protein
VAPPGTAERDAAAGEPVAEAAAHREISGTGETLQLRFAAGNSEDFAADLANSHAQELRLAAVADLDAAAERVGHQVLGERLHELLRVAAPAVETAPVLTGKAGAHLPDAPA